MELVKIEPVKMELPRGINGNIILPFFEMSIENSLATNPKGTIEARVADEEEIEIITDYLGEDNYITKSKKIDEGYELKISAKV